MSSQNKIRLAFAGASGTGKTTTAQLISKKFNMPINPVGSRYITDEMQLRSPYDVDAFGLRQEFQTRLFNNKLEWERINNQFVTDRTHLDNLIYSIMHDCVKTVDKNFINATINATKKYTHIVFFPLELFINTDHDPARRSNIEYQKTYETLLKTFLDCYLPNRYLTLTSVKAEARVEEISEYIR